MSLVLLALLALQVQSPATVATLDEHAATVANAPEPREAGNSDARLVCDPAHRPSPAAAHTAKAAMLLPAPGAQYSVWATVLDSLFTRTGQPTLLIADSTLAQPPFGPGDTTGLQAFGSMPAQLDPALLADFRRRNSRPGAVHPTCLGALGVRVPTAVVSRSEREAAAVDPSTGLYRFESYPGSDAVLSLSQAGFSPDGRQALVHVMFSCGPRCGSTQLVLLTRARGSEWKVSREETGITF